jgi:hypothetical protein
MVQRILNTLLRKEPNPIKVGNNLFLSYNKPVESWTVEEHNNYDHLIERPRIEGLTRMVKSTVEPERRATLTEVFKNAQDTVTELKFGES